MPETKPVSITQGWRKATAGKLQSKPQPGKAKARPQPKGHQKGQVLAKPPGLAQKGKGKGAKKGKGKGGNHGKAKGHPHVKDCQAETEYPAEEDQDWYDWYGYQEEPTWNEETEEYDDQETGGWWGEEEQTEEVETPPADPDPQLRRVIWNHLQGMADEVEERPDIVPNLKAISLKEVSAGVLAARVGEGVLIDGGASHNVYYSPTIPEGSVEREVELAYGSKTGYIIEDDIMFLDETMEKVQNQWCASSA